ncbi:MAG: DUF1127 domain-containing protein [Boseongicola sp.]|nr:MAG: DUF1127 domain-containing protein [Boseongicola sp.]
MSALDIFARNTKRGGFFANISLAMQQYRTYRQTLDELEALSDRELLDLNLSRHQIRSIAYRAAYEG